MFLNYTIDDRLIHYIWRELLDVISVRAELWLQPCCITHCVLIVFTAHLMTLKLWMYPLIITWLLKYNFWFTVCWTLRMKSLQLQDLQETDTFFQTVEPQSERGRFLFWMSFIDLSKSFPAPEFRGVSFPSWRYKELNPAGPAVIELKLLWQTVWAGSRCSAEVSVSEENLGGTLRGKRRLV